MKTKLDTGEIAALARDFKRWGTLAIERILECTGKYGVISSGTVFSDGKAG